MTVKTRFAPSPTGYLHIGSARTALFSWLYARHFGGQFILRIEDTDRERSTSESVLAILEGMRWLGLNHDEGPYYQTQRMDHYQQAIDQLLASNHAYRCSCSHERLDQLRAAQTQAKQKPRYDGHCRDKQINPNTPHVIRFRNPTDGVVSFTDQVYGDIKINNAELDDLILARTDGTPTYNFTVVVDDADMGITHVIRGDDHINNTPRQINLFKALHKPIPIYAHLPMILGADGKRLSKRHGAVGVEQYFAEGFLPEALLNYLVRLGWAHGDQEIFSRKEMIEHFSLTAVSRGTAMFNPEKLAWLNQHYIKAADPNDLVPLVNQQLAKLQIPNQPPAKLLPVIKLQAERANTLKELAEKSTYFFADAIEYDETARQQHLTPESQPILAYIRTQLHQLAHWEEEAISQVLMSTATHFNVKLGKVAQPVRVAVTGNTMSPSIAATLFLIGRDNCLARLGNCISQQSTEN